MSIDDNMTINDDIINRFFEEKHEAKLLVTMSSLS